MYKKNKLLTAGALAFILVICAALLLSLLPRKKLLEPLPAAQQADKIVVKKALH